MVYRGNQRGGAARSLLTGRAAGHDGAALAQGVPRLVETARQMRPLASPTIVLQVPWKGFSPVKRAHRASLATARFTPRCSGCVGLLCFIWQMNVRKALSNEPWEQRAQRHMQPIWPIADLIDNFIERLVQLPGQKRSPKRIVVGGNQRGAL